MNTIETNATITLSQSELSGIAFLLQANIKGHIEDARPDYLKELGIAWLSHNNLIKEKYEMMLMFFALSGYKNMVFDSRKMLEELISTRMKII